MNEREFKDRIRRFAPRVTTLVSSLPKGMLPEVIGRQLLRSGTSVGANYRAACRGRSAADVVNKLEAVEEEADESLFWMELLVDAEVVSSKRLAALINGD